MRLTDLRRAAARATPPELLAVAREGGVRESLASFVLAPGKGQALWAMGSTELMALGFGRELPPGLAGGKTVVSARG